MGLSTVKTTVNTGAVVFQRVDTMLQGGASLDATGLTVGNTLAAGTAIIVDEATRKATVVDADTDAPTGLLYNDVVIAADAEIAVVIEGVVYERRISHAASKTAAIKAKMPRITFSNSF
jgi:hypothetical protein